VPIFAENTNCNRIHRILSPAANGLMGFDCGGQQMNITSVPLLSVDDCALRNHTPNFSETNPILWDAFSHLRRNQRTSRISSGHRIYLMSTNVPGWNPNRRKLRHNRRT